ncbi:hypothetical protein Glove_350g159 [Diversispora epigaea]|uniref:Protein kinase domain-containing protein n=1 Tax=Diversispora epigaea TaxID=1348612 RepID=A0A397HHA7_9GLOM|nr:hypothetical protein Glove_350g159 [Diversispora epigaea]
MHYKLIAHILVDLGLCKPVNYEAKSNEIYGIILYVAPEVLRGNPFTPASDIYSLGMLMWKLTSRKAPFGHRTHDAHLIINIFVQRLPTSGETFHIIFKWRQNKIFEKADEEMKNNIGLEISTQHPEAYDLSRPLNGDDDYNDDDEFYKDIDDDNESNTIENNYYELIILMKC